MNCPKCGFENPDGFKFCGECAHPLEANAKTSSIATATESERKNVTIMFSDLSGYTAMTERLDPEEVKEIMSRIFGEITRIIKKYDGFIERFIGDAVMAVFGIPKAHEDDPVRAIRAAVEILAAVEGISPQYESKIGRSLTMHTGINTGLVITGEVDIEKGTHGLTGDAINLASRLEGIADAGEIIVGANTYHLARSWFEFESLEPTKVKGKSEPISIFKVVSVLDRQGIRTHRLQGVQAELIGRETEMALLINAVEDLKQGKGSVISIIGHAGTGKSRLVREFKNRLEPDVVQWREGHAYAYTKNMAYSPLTNMLTHAFQIREEDNADQIRAKVENGVEALLCDKPDAIKYLGSLFSIDYAEIDEVSPEFWRNELHKSVLQLLEAVASQGATVILFEDLHWADLSFVELLHVLLKNTNRPVLFLCVYRPSFSLFPQGTPDSLSWPHQTLEIRELLWDEIEGMLRSLLGTSSLPDELRYFIKQKVEGNPFYLEEVINTLIETGTLASGNGRWQLTKSLKLADVPTTIQGVLTARLDRLEKQAKRILQEASVIGRTFFYTVLTRITQLATSADGYLSDLESLDLIRTYAKEPELEYIFKHALTQEVVYNGLLKSERQIIHKRVATVIEEIFHGQLHKFYETLAFHYRNSNSSSKAFEYLLKSGDKCLKRYAVEEAHIYYSDAFELLKNNSGKFKKYNPLLLDLLIEWAHVFYYRGDFKGMYELFSLHEKIADSTEDKSKSGIFFAWLGQSFWAKEEFETFEQYLLKALALGEEIKNNKVIGYSCMYLSWNCVEQGRLEDAILFGEKAQMMATLIQNDQYLYFNSLAAIGYAYWYLGEKENAIEVGDILVDYGKTNSNIRSLVMGHFMIGNAYFMEGNFQSAISKFKKALNISVDPLYSQFPRLMLGMSYTLAENPVDAERELTIVSEFGQKYGVEVIGRPAKTFLSVISIINGDISKGVKSIYNNILLSKQLGRKTTVAIFEHVLGKIYLQLVERNKPINFHVILRNFIFLIINLPFAAKKAEIHLKKSIGVANDIGAKAILGQAFLDLGILYKLRKRNDKALKALNKAIRYLEMVDATFFLEQAKKTIVSLKQVE